MYDLLERPKAPKAKASRSHVAQWLGARKRPSADYHWHHRAVEIMPVARWLANSPRLGGPFEQDYHAIIDEPPATAISQQISIAAYEYSVSKTTYLTALVNQTPEHEDTALEAVIKSSRWILQLTDDFDGEGSQGYSETTWIRATGFLHRHVTYAREVHGEYIRLPEINPADSGSLDLFWEGSDFQLLVNFPAHEEASASFFGRDQDGETIGGTFRHDSTYPELISWLLRHQ